MNLESTKNRNNTDIVGEFITLYNADWRRRWLKPGENPNEVATPGSYAETTLPKPVLHADTSRLVGLETSYVSFITAIGDSNMELPFHFVLGNYSGVSWLDDRFFFCVQHDGAFHLAFQRNLTGIFGFDENDQALGAVAESFGSFIQMLAVAIRNNAGVNPSSSATVWKSLSERDSVAAAASDFWAVVLGL